jgi:hypothetical protein
MTLNIMTLSVTAFNIITFSKRIYSITIFRIKTLSIYKLTNGSNKPECLTLTSIYSLL